MNSFALWCWVCHGKESGKTARFHHVTPAMASVDVQLSDASIAGVGLSGKIGGMTSLPNLQPLVDALREVVLEHSVVHADETPVQVLMPGAKKTHRAYVWAYATTASADIRAVVYDFSPSRSGEHARAFLQDRKGKLVCDDFGGYKASFATGVTEIGCMAHARRKFFDLHATNKSQLAEQASRYIQVLYEIEQEVRDLEPNARRRIRQEKAVLAMACFRK